MFAYKEKELEILIRAVRIYNKDLKNDKDLALEKVPS